MKQSGQRRCSCQGDKLCLLSGLGSQGLSLSLSHGGLQSLKPGRAVPNKLRPLLQTWRLQGPDRKLKPVMQAGCLLLISENVLPSESIFYFPTFATDMDREKYFFTIAVLKCPLWTPGGRLEILSGDS